MRQSGYLGLHITLYGPINVIKNIGRNIAKYRGISNIWTCEIDYLSDLTHDVGCEALSFASVMNHKTSFIFLLHEEWRRFELKQMTLKFDKNLVLLRPGLIFYAWCRVARKRP